MTTLVYELRSLNPHDTFEEAPPWRGELDGWRCVLEGGWLEAASDRRYADEGEARAALEPLLRAWETSAYLTGQHEIRFRPAGMADEAPGTPAAEADRERIFRRVNVAYPSPDPSFGVTPVVARLVQLIDGFRAGSLELPAAVGEGLAALESSAATAGSTVADAHNIDERVIETLRELSERGAAGPDDGRPLYRGPEWQWMQEALRLLALQAGRRSNAAAPVPRLSLEDFRARL